MSLSTAYETAFSMVETSFSMVQPSVNWRIGLVPKEMHLLEFAFHAWIVTLPDGSISFIRVLTAAPGRILEIIFSDMR